MKTSIKTAILLVTALFLAAGCNDFSFFDQLGDSRSGSEALAIAPGSISVVGGGSVTFSASGGSAPYSFSVASGSGSIDGGTGVYTAPLTTTTETVRVTDAAGSSAEAAVTVTSSGGPLAISPSSATIAVNNGFTFMASGGVAPYSFSISSVGSGSPLIDGATGAYTAGSSNGSDTITVTDSAASTATATVSVTTASTNVDYRIASASLPSTGLGGRSISAGFSFTIENIGSANGAQTVNWNLYISADTSLGSGDSLLSNGTTAALSSGGSVSIPVSGTWPLAGASYNLFITLSAADDLTTTNNEYGPSAVTVTDPDVNYTVTAVNNSGSTVAGDAMSGTFDVQNIGTDNGLKTTYWTAYISADTIIDAADPVAGTGTLGPLNAGSSVTGTAFSGTWPQTVSSYYLIIELSAEDDISTTNNKGTTAAAVGLTPPAVDYEASSVGSSGGTTAGGTLSGSFWLTNIGSNNGSQMVFWEVYASIDTAIDGSDSLIQTGSQTALAASGSVNPSFSGNWPTAAGSYYLIVQASAGDDVNSSNDISWTASAIAVSAPDIDYRISTVSLGTYSIVPDGSVNGTFQYENIGTENGSQDLGWTAYASKDLILDGSDAYIDSGSGLAPLNAAAGSGNIAFSGNWPLDYGNYYILIQLSTVDDVNTANNLGYNGGTTSVGILNESLSEVNDDFTGLTNFYDTKIILKPGMSIRIDGTMGSTDTDDVLGFDTGSAAEITLTITWATGADDIRLFLMDGPNSFLTGVHGTTDWNSLYWNITTANVYRYINVENYYGNTNIGNYILTISAN